MFDGLRGMAERRSDAAGRGAGDPLARTILLDLLITSAGFLMVVVAVVLAVQGLSVN